MQAEIPVKPPSTDRPRVELPMVWPDPPLHIVLFEPEIPPNTGNIARLCAGTGTRLHLIEPLGFRLTERALRRAGLDYWDAVDFSVHRSFRAYLESERPARLFPLSTSGTIPYTAPTFQPGDAFLFGPESRGLPMELLADYPDYTLNVPIRLDAVRSINLATCAGIVLYEALRQIQLIPPV